MTSEYEKLLLLKSPQNKVASNIVTIKKDKKEVKHICRGHFKIKLLIFQTSQHLNVMFYLKNASLNDSDNQYDRK